MPVGPKQGAPLMELLARKLREKAPRVVEAINYMTGPDNPPVEAALKGMELVGKADPYGVMQPSMVKMVKGVPVIDASGWKPTKKQALDHLVDLIREDAANPSTPVKVRQLHNNMAARYQATPLSEHSLSNLVDVIAAKYAVRSEAAASPEAAKYFKQEADAWAKMFGDLVKEGK